MQAHIGESGNKCIWWKIVFHWPNIENMFSLNNERVAKGFCVTRDGPKISSVTPDGAKISRVIWDWTSQRDAWFSILQARDAWFTNYISVISELSLTYM